MYISDLDNKEQRWKLNGYEIRWERRPRSKLHLQARELIKEKFPTLQVLEEVPVPLKRGKTGYLDFYLPLRKIAIEVHGEQHYQFNTKYHGSTKDFLKQKKNDALKADWLDKNGIMLIVLRYDELDHWSEQI